MSEADTPQELKTLESALGSLPPAALRLDRDRLMYLAGQASGQPQVPAAGGPGRSWFWPTATAAMGAVAAALLLLVLNSPGPQVIERVVYIPSDAVSQTDERTNDAIAAQPHGRELALQRWAPRVEPGSSFGSGLLGLIDPVERPEYLRVRDQVLAFGVDTWQRPAAGGSSQPGQAPSYREALDSLLRPNPTTRPEPPDSPESTNADVGVQL
jgi:hypothetical protein